MKNTIIFLSTLISLSTALPFTTPIPSDTVAAKQQSLATTRQDETFNVVITDFDDKPKNSDAAYEYNISTNDSHTIGIKVASKSELDGIDLSKLTLSANWSGTAAGSSTPLPAWITVTGIQNIAYSSDHKTVTFNLVFSINQDLLLAEIGSLDNIRMLNIRIATNFGDPSSQNAGTITFEIVSEG